MHVSQCSWPHDPIRAISPGGIQLQLQFPDPRSWGLANGVPFLAPMLDQEATSTWRISMSIYSCMHLLLYGTSSFLPLKPLEIGLHSPSSTQPQLGTNTKYPLEVASILDIHQGIFHDLHNRRNFWFFIKSITLLKLRTMVHHWTSSPMH